MIEEGRENLTQGFIGVKHDLDHTSLLSLAIIQDIGQDPACVSGNDGVMVSCVQHITIFGNMEIVQHTAEPFYRNI